jgi:hypothetical protein
MVLKEVRDLKGKTRKRKVNLEVKVVIQCVFQHHCNKCLRSTTYKEKRFAWAHGFGSFNPWLVSPIPLNQWQHITEGVCG